VTLDKRDPDDHAGDPESGTPVTPTDELWQHGPYSNETWIVDDLHRMNFLRRVEIHAVGIGEVSGGFLQQVANAGDGRVRQIATDAPATKK